MTAPSDAPSQVLTCKLCPETFTMPRIQYAPGVAAVFGMTAEALGQVHLGQEMHRLEADIDRHMRGHTVVEWIEPLNVRDEIIARVRAYAAEAAARDEVTFVDGYDARARQLAQDVLDIVNEGTL